MGKYINIKEVGPRDGFQNVKKYIPVETKLQMIEGIVKSGIKNVQITSFMNPKAVPQTSDAAQIAQVCLEKYPNTGIYALAANKRGVDNACRCGLRNLSFVTSVTEGHNKANVRKSVDESVEELRECMAEYPEICFTWDVSMAFGCSFEGEVTVEQLVRHIEKGLSIGLHRFNLCDTIGIATPLMIEERVLRLLKEFPEEYFSVHVHDTRNMGMVNSLRAIECGITEIETSIGGLGGCPFSPGASGNTSTEDLVFMLNRMGYETGIDFDRLLDVSKGCKEKIEGNYSGHHINIGNECRIQ